MSNYLISVVGPTAIGKTSLAITLANYFNTEIVSADSRQFYKEMFIGTAVPNAEELAAAHHHCVQHKSIQELYTVGDFEKEAIQILNSQFRNINVMVMVGGSGLYIDAVTKGLNKFPTIDPAIRISLNADLSKNGVQPLQQRLQKLDPEYYNIVDLANPHRVIRALEVCMGSGKPYSSFINQKKPDRPFKVITIGITADREIIYNRINQRVDIMIENGLVEEVKSLYEFKSLNALQTVGYRELMPFLENRVDLEDAVAEIKKNTRRFAKRQLTWFRKNENTIWVPYKYTIADITTTIERQIA